MNHVGERYRHYKKTAAMAMIFVWFNFIICGGNFFTSGKCDSGRLMKNVSSDGKTRRERTKKRSLQKVNEHFESLSNAVMPSAAVFQPPASAATP